MVWLILCLHLDFPSHFLICISFPNLPLTITPVLFLCSLPDCYVAGSFMPWFFSPFTWFLFYLIYLRLFYLPVLDLALYFGLSIFCLPLGFVSCWNISVWTKVVDQPTGQHCHPQSHAISIQCPQQVNTFSLYTGSVLPLLSNRFFLNCPLRVSCKAMKLGKDLFFFN